MLQALCRSPRMCCNDAISTPFMMGHRDARRRVIASIKEYEHQMAEDALKYVLLRFHKAEDC